MKRRVKSSRHQVEIGDEKEEREGKEGVERRVKSGGCQVGIGDEIRLENKK